MQKFHLHLISDATGETVESVARACLVQFDEVEPVEHLWNMMALNWNDQKGLQRHA